MENKYFIYYYNTDDNRGTDTYDSIISIFNVESVPLVVEIKNGKEQRRLEYTDDTEVIKKFFEEGK